MRNHPIPQKNPNYQLADRNFKNAFGIEENVVMRVRHWEHFDWLAEQGCDMDAWVIDADLNRHKKDYTLDIGRELEKSLSKSEKRRYLAGYSCPLFIEPDGYFGEIIPEEIPERLMTDHEWFERKLVGKLGVEVPVSMQGRYWRYFNWMAEKNFDMQRWVIAADFETATSKRSLATEMMGALRRHEREYSLYGNDLLGDRIPLFITPNGYDR